MRLNQAKKDAGERAKVLEVGCPPRSPTAVPGFLSPTLGWKEEDATKARIFLVQECTVEHPMSALEDMCGRDLVDRSTRC